MLTVGVLDVAMEEFKGSLRLNMRGRREMPLWGFENKFT